MLQVDAIVTQAYSRLKNGKIGPGNELLVQTARALHKKYNLPIIPQEEITMADPTLPCVAVAGGSPDGRSTFSWNTYSVCEFQARVCKERGWRKVIVVTVPIHTRALFVYEKLGLEPIMAPMHAMSRYKHPDLVHFSLRSGLIPSLMLPVREFICRILFLLQGKM